jgi:hypothetical protein
MKVYSFILSLVLLSFVLSSCCDCERPENEVGRYIPYHSEMSQLNILDTKTGIIYFKSTGNSTWFIDIKEKNSVTKELK